MIWRGVHWLAQKAGYAMLDLSDWAEAKARRARR